MRVELELNLSNLGRLYDLALETNENATCERCLRFLRENLDQIISEEELYCRLPSSLVVKVLQFAAHHVTGIDLFLFMRNWLFCNGNSSDNDVIKSFPWHVLTADEFYKLVKPLGWISNDEYFAAHMKYLANNNEAKENKCEDSLNSNENEGKDVNDENMQFECGIKRPLSPVLDANNNTGNERNEEEENHSPKRTKVTEIKEPQVIILESENEIKVEEEDNLLVDNDNNQVEDVEVTNSMLSCSTITEVASIDECTQTEVNVVDAFKKTEETKEIISQDIRALSQSEYKSVNDTIEKFGSIGINLCKNKDVAKDLSEICAIDLLLLLVYHRVNTRNCDKLLTDAWIALYIIIKDDDELMKFFLKSNGAQHVIDSFRICSTKDKIYVYIVSLICILLETKDRSLIEKITAADVISAIFESFRKTSDFSFKYIYCYLLLMWCEQKDLIDSTLNQSNLKRSKILNCVEKCIEKWAFTSEVKHDLKSYKRVIQLGLENESDVFRLFSLWSIAYFTHKDSDVNCPLVDLNTIRRIAKDNTSDVFFTLKQSALNSMIDWKEKQR